jgi:hypothetical protein
MSFGEGLSRDHAAVGLLQFTKDAKRSLRGSAVKLVEPERQGVPSNKILGQQVMSGCTAAGKR